MKRDKLIPGIILIGLGVIFLLHSFGVVHFHWFNLIRMWPIFLVIAGANLLLSNVRAPWAGVVKVVVVLGGICILLFASVDDRRGGWPGFTFNYQADDDDDDHDNTENRRVVHMEGTNQYTESFHEGVKYAKLNVNGGATRYELRDSTNDLFQAFANGAGNRYNFNSEGKDSSYTVNFNMAKNKGNKFEWSGDKQDNKAQLKLNTQPIWDIDLNTGATEVDFDLSKFKIRNFELNGGVASYTVKMGQPLTSTNLDINTGMSEVKVSIPQNVACQIVTDSGLSSNHFEGFNKVGEKRYETPGFANAANKMYINISGGISEFKVDRY